jgi:hypothetical protein
MLLQRTGPVLLKQAKEQQLGFSFNIFRSVFQLNDVLSPFKFKLTGEFIQRGVNTYICF